MQRGNNRYNVANDECGCFEERKKAFTGLVELGTGEMVISGM
jgi:hypothetical protein